MANTLEDIVEPQNVRNPVSIPNDYEDRTKGRGPESSPEVNPAGFTAAVVDFRYLGIKYKASDLWGYGIDSTCSTCTNHYSIVFMEKELAKESYVLRPYGDYFVLVLPVDNTIKDGHQLCKYIVDEINKQKNSWFIDHYQQYAYKDECLYVYDNRSMQLGSFFTSVHVMPIALKAKYRGQPIKLHEDYLKSDVEVTLIYSDRATRVLSNSEWTPSSLTVTVIGENIFTATYNENTNLTGEYVVNGYWIEKIEAKYIGPDIPVQEYYDTHDVEVRAIFGDGTYEVLDWDKLKWEKDLYINDNGLLRRFVSYTDELGRELTTDYYVPGVPRPIGIRAKYLSVKKVEGSTIQKGEVRVYATYLLNDFDMDHRQTEERVIPTDEWEFANTNIVNKSNNGVLWVNWNTRAGVMGFYFNDYIKVPLIDGTDCYLVAWYEGPDIEVGRAYNLGHVIVYFCEPGKDRIQLHYFDQGVIMDRDITVRKEDDNEYEVCYQYGRWLLRAKYYVPGVISKKYPNLFFKVVHIEKDTFKETNLTEDFRPYFTYQGAFTISWNQFMLRIRDYEKEENPYFGMFRVDAPKRTGLWDKYASSWHVYVFNTRCLKAEIYKVYCEPIPIKESDKDGKAKKDNSS